MELVVEDLGCRRAGRRVVAGVGFRLAAGRALILTGPNGAGKSSLLRVLAGLIPAEAGSARLGDTGLAAGEDWRALVAYAGHLDAAKPALSVAENLEAWSGLYGGGAVGPALAAFGLDRIAGLPAAWCSAGQRRRLGLARLLLARRSLWLLDEPTVSLDTAAVEAVARILQEHLAQGGLAVVATHAPLGVAGETLALSPPAPEAAAADPFLAGWP